MTAVSTKDSATMVQEKNDQYVCIDVKDEDPDTTDEEKSPKWIFTNKSGFYWAGAYATDDFVVLGMENAKANTTDPARIVTLDKKLRKRYRY